MRSDLSIDSEREVVPESSPRSCIRELTPFTEKSPNVSFEAPPAPTSRTEIPAFEVQTAADGIIDALVKEGVDTFFGIPGGPVSPVFDSILRHPGATLVESRHESAAAFAATAYYRASGKVPAVVVTAGPGATNAVTGVCSAHNEGVPLVLVIGDVAWAANGGRLLQNSGPEGIDVESLFDKMTRRAVRVTSPSAASSQATAVLEAATDPANPGPALLVVPIDRGAAKTDGFRVSRTVTRRLSEPDRSVVLEVCRLLAQAEHPLLVFGSGARPYSKVLRRLVDALDVPFVTTPKAKGIVSEEHPRSLRHGGLAASIWARDYTKLGVDVAVVLGTDLDDCSVGPTPYVAPGGRLVHVDRDATVFNRNLPTELGVVSDVGAFAEKMYDVVLEEGLRNTRCRGKLRELRARSPFDDATFGGEDQPLITPQRAVVELERAAGANATFVTDIGEHMLFALHYLTAKDPKGFQIQLGLGSMGSGVSGAIGAAIGNRARPVVCICGDGSMQMAGMELLVAAKERLPVIFAVFNDARYNMVYHGYKQVFGREAQWSTDFVDFAAWARSMGVTGVRVNHPGEIREELFDRLLELGGPAVLDIRIDRDVRLAGGGRNEALQHMSMLSNKGVA
ncbi:MAG: thiamine pyrophosphate-binding protein [Polyangiaceae bacterium]|nr:thiamine pyrophosphate-binding protein [Myxococcales bacterium]MCB9588476.1 thiamine pyrophosphate-binding protein [Polyangiaceae bacterium]